MSTIIIRLQNLPLSAKAADIREFFGDLKIPKGSVNIVGGTMGDAFIGFSSDEDARIAMLLDGRSLHNSKIHLMLSSRREMEQVIADAQAQAVKPSGTAEPTVQMPQIKSEQKFGQNGLASPPIAQKEPKIEVISPALGSQTAAQPSTFPFLAPNMALPPPQILQPQQPSGGPQQSFSSDSWKNPQKMALPPPTQTAPPPSQAGLTIFTAGGSIPQVSGGTGTALAPQMPQQQHHYQQLPQPPGFPPPINQTANAILFQQPNVPMAQRPPYPSSIFGPPIAQNTGANDTFFNQPPPPQQQIGVPPRFPQQFAGGPPQNQQQHFFGGAAPPHGHFGGGFRQPGVGGQQQFGRRTPNQPFGQLQGGPRPFGHQQQPRFQQQFGGGRDAKRRRSRSPEGPNKRQQQKIGGFSGTAGEERYPGEQQYDGKLRICIQLMNVPYKATYDDIQQYLREIRVKPIKCTRVYQQNKNLSDRWIVEFDNDEDGRAVCRYRGEMKGKTINFVIRAERIPPRRADEQYAVNEPEESGTSGRSRRDDLRRDGRRDRSRDRERRNRDRSRGDGSRSRPSSRDRPNRGADREREDKEHSNRGNRSRERSRERNKGGNNDGRRRSRERSRERQQRTRKASKEEIKEEQPKIEERQTNAPSSTVSTSNIGPGAPPAFAPPNSSQPPPATTFGAFAFPGSTTQGVYNVKSGTTVQLGAKDGNKSMPLFDAQPPQFFPSVRPPSYFGKNGNGNNNNISPPMSGQQQLPFRPQHFPPLQPQIGNFPNQFRPMGKSATGANAIPMGQRPMSADSGPQQPQVPTIPNAQMTPPMDFPASSLPFLSSAGSSSGLESIYGSGGRLIIDTGSLDGDENSADGTASNEIHLPIVGIPQSDKLDQKQQQKEFASFSTPLPAIPDQPPLDLLEPENGNHEDKPVFSLPIHSAVQQCLPPPDPRTFPKPMSGIISPPLVHQRRSDQQQQLREYSPQEVELRPHLLFLDQYWQLDPNASSCIRLENVPKMVFVDQLSDFLGVKIESPCQNIARMFNGVLYIHLENEMMARKAAAKSGQLLAGTGIAISQLKRSEMADAIRQNMIIIREMYRLTVVARGFPLLVQPAEVISMFERFNVNKEGVEKCAVKSTDTISTFLLTFPTVQDCRNAIHALNGTQIAGGSRLEVFQPEGLGI